MKMFRIAQNVAVYRGESAYNKGGNFYTTDKEWARQFTQSGRDGEILTYSIDWNSVYVPNGLPKAYGTYDDFDDVVNEAMNLGFKAILMDEGSGQPNSIYVLDKSILQPYSNVQSLDNIQEPNYPLAGATIDGLEILKDVPNVDSIAATFDNYQIMSGIRIVPMDDFDINGKSYSFYENERIRGLVGEIKETKKISPLIVVVESEGPYILEGSHRVDALFLLGFKRFPALVVLNEDI